MVQRVLDKSLFGSSMLANVISHVGAYTRGVDRGLDLFFFLQKDTVCECFYSKQKITQT